MICDKTRIKLNEAQQNIMKLNRIQWHEMKNTEILQNVKMQ